MVDEILKLTKYNFLLHLIVGAIFAILFWIPTVFGLIFNVTIESLSIAAAFAQMIGALFTGLTVSSLLGFMAKEWKQVRIVVIHEVIWLLAGTIAAIINFTALGISAVLFALLMIMFLVLFLVVLLKQEEII